MKKYLIKWFGKEWYCRNFHSHIMHDNQWYCNKCDMHFKVYPSQILPGAGGPR